jgi:hypothetical protein
MEDWQLAEEVGFKILIGGLAGGALLLGIGSFLIYRRRKKKMKLINIFPNPFREQMTVTFSLPENAKNPVVEIYNLQGNLVKSEALEGSDSEHVIATLNLIRGAYIVRIMDGDQKSNAFKVLKM